jgi:hypothetical protein
MRRLSLAAVLILVASIAVATAAAELIQGGDLRVSFQAKLSPRALPRERPAPVTVSLSGSVRTVDGSRPPQLRKIKIGVNRAGLISVEGLPICTAPELQQTSTEAALARCRSALVGRGRFAVNVDFPDAPLIPAQGRLLVFNSRSHGRPAMLAHLYGSSPVRAAFVLPFKVSHPRSGDFGTVFSTKIPELASDLGYVTDISMTIGRKYNVDGERRSFMSASCAAPAGFPGAIFKLARATFLFADGVRLSTALTRDCRVRG